MIYATKAYTDLQDYQNLKRYESSEITICFEIVEHRAVSLPFSPAGGIAFANCNREIFIESLLNIEEDLKKQGISLVEITLPIQVYNRPDTSWITSLGYKESVIETAHYIELSGHLADRMHQMQRRKLKKQSEFDFQIVPISDLEKHYDFIQESRFETNIPLNITHQKLQGLIETFPNHYQIHSAVYHNEIAATCVMVTPTPQVAYYFLPATSEKHRGKSPMVGLINWMYSYYQHLNFKYLDLGISSKMGNPQERLIAFKERMGGVKTERITFEKSLN